MRFCFTIILLFTSLYANAQIGYEYDDSIPVRINNEILPMPWAGGLNAVQYNSFDLNSNGIEDLVLFDRTSNKISTYLAEDNGYVYAPDYESSFPEGMTNWVIMRDYDCDGKKDIFTSNPFGMTLYHNVSTETSLVWEISADPVTTLGTGAIINLKLNGSDIPAIEDIDGDGDLDILMFGFNGGGLQYHQNFSIERTGSCGLPDFERITTSWGNFTECGCGTVVFGSESCRTDGGRQEHVGGKSLLAYDMDGDGDMEVVFGEEDCNVLLLLENKGDATNPIMDSHTVFPPKEFPPTFGNFPAAYLVDMTFDGKKDLVISSNTSSNSIFSPTNFQNSNWFYENNGSTDVPNFQLQSENFLQEHMLDFGNNSSVVFVDVDGDNDLDMLATSHGQSIQASNYASRIALFENTGTIATPSFTLLDEDYLNLSGLRMSDMTLQIADINTDSKLDLILAIGELNSNAQRIFYVSNQSTDGLDFTNQQLQQITLPTPGLLSSDNPFFYDIDKDGLIDLLIGKGDGKLEYYRNSGNSSQPDYQIESEGFYGFEDANFTNRNLVPIIGDLDGNGKEELITTDGSGELYIYENFLDHLDNPQEGNNKVYFNRLTETWTPFRLGIKVHPTVAHLNNSGTPYIVLGTAQGGLQLLKNTEALPPTFGDTNDLLSIFPNPGRMGENNGVIEISSKEPIAVRIISVLGKEVYSSRPIKPSDNMLLSIDALPSGMYLVIGERDGQVIDQAKFIIEN